MRPGITLNFKLPPAHVLQRDRSENCTKSLEREYLTTSQMERRHPEKAILLCSFILIVENNETEAPIKTTMRHCFIKWINKIYCFGKLDMQIWSLLIITTFFWEYMSNAGFIVNNIHIKDSDTFSVVLALYSRPFDLKWDNDYESKVLSVRQNKSPFLCVTAQILHWTKEQAR